MSSAVVSVDISEPRQNLRDIQPPEKPDQLGEFVIRPLLIEASSLIKAGKARDIFKVSGKGLTVAVLDTGLYVEHEDFIGAVIPGQNFSGGDVANTSDLNGHGTNVGGIIVAHGRHRGIAPGARIVPLKVLSDNGNGNFEAVQKALQWVLDNRQKHNISVVSMSLGAYSNFKDDAQFNTDKVQKLIQDLRKVDVPVVIAAGNDFYAHHSEEGMSYPAIMRPCVSVGAVYDKAEGEFRYGDGATADSGVDRLTPFTQRLHPTTNATCYTDIFAPGAPITSSGNTGPHSESIQHGTSQAAPVISGVILLLQEFYLRHTGRLPSVDRVVTALRNGKRIFDGDDEQDNVTNTDKWYIRVDAYKALVSMQQQVRYDTLPATVAVSWKKFQRPSRKSRKDMNDQ